MSRTKAKVHQPILGLVAARPVKKPTPFQTEMMRRQQLGGHAPSILSPGQQIAARRRADREEAISAKSLQDAYDNTPNGYGPQQEVYSPNLRGILKRL